MIVLDTNALVAALRSREAAAADGVVMNQYVAVALAEKLATRQTAQHFLAERAARGSVQRALEILEHAGSDENEAVTVSRINTQSFAG